MMADQSDSRQQELAFGDAEAVHVGRWNDVSLALSRIGTKCDLHLSRFVRMVFDMTQGGTTGALTKSNRALAERPAWLCCSERKVRNTVAMAKRLGLVTITNRRAWGGSQEVNGYTINWAGIREIIAGTGGTSCLAPGTTCLGLGTTSQGHGTTCRHNKEYKLSRSSIEETSGTGPGGRSESADGFRFANACG